MGKPAVATWRVFVVFQNLHCPFELFGSDGNLVALNIDADIAVDVGDCGGATFRTVAEGLAGEDDLAAVLSDQLADGLVISGDDQAVKAADTP